MILLFSLSPLAGHATTFTFAPHDGTAPQGDLYDLDHAKIYLWAIRWSLPQHEEIASAALHINDIYNWDYQYNILKLYLLDNVKKNDQPSKVDVITLTDDQRTDPRFEIGYYEYAPGKPATRVKFSDYLPLYTQVNIPGPPKPNYQSPIDITYTFTEAQIDTLTSYLASPNPYGFNSTFGIGFDPDCHFYNNGITLVIETAASVPEPATLLLLGAGLAGFAGFRKRRSRR
ncbi:MAG: PEP-CTERM sorting domain-containing protein [Thermodesulfobacteriota bacterium]